MTKLALALSRARETLHRRAETPIAVGQIWQNRQYSFAELKILSLSVTDGKAYVQIEIIAEDRHAGWECGQIEEFYPVTDLLTEWEFIV